MSIGIITQFEVNAPLPIDSRLVVADAAARHDGVTINSAFMYNGLVVYQADSQELWVLIDKNEYTSDIKGWRRFNVNAGTFSADDITFSNSASLFTYNPISHSGCFIEYQMVFTREGWDKYDPALTTGGYIKVGAPIYTQTGSLYSSHASGSIPYTKTTTTNILPVSVQLATSSYNSEPVEFKVKLQGDPPMVEVSVYHITHTNDITGSIRGNYRLIDIPTF